MAVPEKEELRNGILAGDPKGMSAQGVIEQLKSGFLQLSPQLQKAARHVIDNPSDIAVHSMRSIAKKAGVQHNTMVRLAREFGFDGYEQFRILFQNFVTREADADWLHRAKFIHDRFPVGADNQFAGAYISQAADNLKRTFNDVTEYKLRDAVSRLLRARNIYVLGVRSMFPLAYYFHYTYRMFDSRSVILTGLGGAFADDLRSMRKTDVLVVFSYYPYAKDTVMAVDFAKARGATILSITDSEVSPVIDETGVNFVVNNNSVPLFPSLVPALSIAEVLVTLALSEGGQSAMETLAKTQEQLKNFGVYCR